MCISQENIWVFQFGKLIGILDSEIPMLEMENMGSYRLSKFGIDEHYAQQIQVGHITYPFCIVCFFSNTISNGKCQCVI